MPQWYTVGYGDLAQRKAGVNVFDMRQIQQYFTCQAGKGFEVGGHHLQLKRSGAADVVARHDLRHPGNGGL